MIDIQTLRNSAARSLASALLLLLVAGAASAGICLDSDVSCNDYFFSVEAGENDIKTLTGYEYGCGLQTREATGVLRTIDGNHYIGITGSNGSVFDTGQIVQWNYVIDTGTLLGDYEANFVYMSGGVLAGHGSTGTVTASSCSDPGFAPLATGPDISVAP